MACVDDTERTHSSVTSLMLIRKGTDDRVEVNVILPDRVGAVLEDSRSSIFHFETVDGLSFIQQ